MPSKNRTFTRASILVRPHGWRDRLARSLAKLVEAPGTAPGSASAITYDVYRHSRFPDEAKYKRSRGLVKGAVAGVAIASGAEDRRGAIIIWPRPKGCNAPVFEKIATVA